MPPSTKGHMVHVSVLNGDAMIMRGRRARPIPHLCGAHVEHGAAKAVAERHKHHAVVRELGGRGFRDGGERRFGGQVAGGNATA